MGSLQNANEAVWVTGQSMLTIHPPFFLPYFCAIQQRNHGNHNNKNNCMIPIIPGNPLIHLLDILNTGEYWRYLIGARHQARGRIGYAEKNYIQALLNGVCLMSEWMGQRLTVHSIKELHATVMHLVSDTPHSTGELSSFECRACDVAFGLTVHTASEEGLRHFIHRLRGPNCSFLLLMTAVSTGTEHYLTSENIDEKLMAEGEAGLVLKLQELNSKFQTTHFEDNDSVSIERILDNLLVIYYEKIGACVTSEEKLRAIVEFCQQAIQLHPFRDGNGRLFCMLIPQFLCLQNNFPLSLMAEVNMFAAHTIEQIIEGVASGFFNTEILLKGGMPDKFPDYFDESAVDIFSYRQAVKAASNNIAKKCDIETQILNACRYDDVSLLEELLLERRSLDGLINVLIMEVIEKYSSVSCYEFLREREFFPLEDLSPYCAAIYFVRHHEQEKLVAILEAISVEELKVIFIEACSLDYAPVLTILYENILRAGLGLDFCDHKGRSPLSESLRFNHQEIALWLMRIGANSSGLYKDHPFDLLALNNRNLILLQALNLSHCCALSIFHGRHFNENTVALFNRLKEESPDLIDFLMTKPYVQDLSFLKILYIESSVHMIYAVQSFRSAYRLSMSDFDLDLYIKIGHAIVRQVNHGEFEKINFLLKCLPDFCYQMNKLHLLIEVGAWFYCDDFFEELKSPGLYLTSSYEDQLPIEMALIKKENKIFQSFARIKRYCLKTKNPKTKSLMQT